ncbi:MAG TPA: HXXEE domain-containing protein [Acidobacteriota bacterium]|nr:HXXEE domain-containing protein [Acidobacteriota bacterium]
MTWLWWTPLATVVLHMSEEFAWPGGFAAWDRSYRPAIRKSITRRLHIIINAALLLVCVQTGLLARAPEVEAQSFGIAAWLTIAALLCSNAVFHVIGTVRTRAYSPGVVTAVALYIPLAAFGFWYFLHHGQVSWLTATAAAIVGGSYHFWAALLHKVRLHHAL